VLILTWTVAHYNISITKMQFDGENICIQSNHNIVFTLGTIQYDNPLINCENENNSLLLSASMNAIFLNNNLISMIRLTQHILKL